MLAQTGLYYPYIHFRDDNWLKLAALYWEQCRLVKLVGRPGGARVSRGDAYSELW
jgi:hypothetical protein